MADKIKKFFQKKKTDAKFKMAGPGHKLTEQEPNRSRPNSEKKAVAPNRVALSSEARQAAAAALSRLDGSRQNSGSPAFNTSLAAIQMQVRKEVEAEKKAAEAAATKPDTKIPETLEDPNKSPYLAVTGVYFTCSMINDEVLTKEEWHNKIKEFLYEQLAEVPGLTACLIIHSCNKNKEKVRLCVETLCKYLDNIMKNPDEEKFKKIRISNRIFQDRVKSVEGVFEFLKAAGFEICKQVTDNGEEDFYVFSADKLEGEDTLQILYDALQGAEPIGLELDRNLQVLYPSQAAKRNDLPSTFFSLSPEEIKKEQQIREEILEKNLMLRTKAMREKEEQRELRKYRYALIRVRFPDGVLLQGTFTVFEKLEMVYQYVQENLNDERMKFTLCSPSGHKFSEDDMDHSLLDLRLMPASILTFVLDNPSTKHHEEMYLKSEVMMLVQPL